MSDRPGSVWYFREEESMSASIVRVGHGRSVVIEGDREIVGAIVDSIADLDTERVVVQTLVCAHGRTIPKMIVLERGSVVGACCDREDDWVVAVLPIRPGWNVVNAGPLFQPVSVSHTVRVAV